MDNWKELLAEVDDDYLIGISNKGTVKRAYKDKEEVVSAVGEAGEETEVRVGDETVKVRFPLGESRCSCPSRSICRHIILAILLLKENCLKCSASSAGEEAGPGAAPPEALQQETKPDKDVNSVIPTAAAKDTEELKQAGQDNAAQDTGGSGKVLAEIVRFPLAQLKKVLGSRQLQTIYSQLLSGTRPEIHYSSIVTVQFPGQTTMVKLLSPLEYSSCTCHKKELCVHKAAAILWCQLAAGIVKEEDLAVQAADTPSFQMSKAQEAAGQMKTFLEELLATGLSRSSPDVLDYLERLAIISHNAGLAKFEGYFRSLSDSYDRYFQRKAAFCTAELMEQITRLYRRVSLLEAAVKTGDSGEVLKHAGEFRADYVPVGNLDLIGIAMEDFQTQTGYEGETIYFLEENTKQWYTYTNARPMFYENARNRKYMEKSQAPWGLNIPVADLAKVRIHLTGAKCDARKRLSSSQETRGEITGEQKLERSAVEGWYYEDFGKLFSEQIGRPGKQWLYGQEEEQKGVEPVFVQPAYVVKADFSQTGQQLSMPLYDKAGREIVIEMTYSKRESGAIRYLERISEREPFCFLGKIYLRDGKIRMYPVEVYKDFLSQ